MIFSKVKWLVVTIGVAGALRTISNECPQAAKDGRVEFHDVELVDKQPGFVGGGAVQSVKNLLQEGFLWTMISFGEKNLSGDGTVVDPRHGEGECDIEESTPLTPSKGDRSRKIKRYGRIDITRCSRSRTARRLVVGSILGFILGVIFWILQTRS